MRHSDERCGHYNRLIEYLFQGFSCLAILLFCNTPASSAVKGLTGEIRFDVNSDSNAEMILSGGNLGIGTLTPAANLHVQGNAIITKSLTVGGGENSSGSNLHVNGTIAYAPNVFSTGLSYITDQSLVLADTSAGDVALYLPSAIDNLGNMITIKRTSDLNNLYLSASGNLMDSYAIVMFSSGNMNTLSLISNGSNWLIMGGKDIENVSEHMYMNWDLEESSGNTAQDDSGWGRSGTLQANYQFSGNSVSGPQNNALLFDDIDAAIEFSGNQISPAIGYTYAMWVKASEGSDDAVDLPPEIIGNAGFVYGHHDTSLRRAAYHRLSDGSLITTQHGSTLSANTWYHLGVTWDGTDLQLYVDGVASTSSSASDWSGGTSFTALHPGHFYGGNVIYDDVRFYTRALSATLMQAIKLEGSP
ncbi:MAG: LamG domain-containing protein [Planctomycetes bacterium]|nr:LamG domain-containing protein [Planctomycetota bacterium]